VELPRAVQMVKRLDGGAPARGALARDGDRLASHRGRQRAAVRLSEQAVDLLRIAREQGRGEAFQPGDHGSSIVRY
jgi:hypothetical protein